MKLATAFLALASSATNNFVRADCEGTYQFAFDGECTKDKIVAEFETVATAGGCNVTTVDSELFVCPEYPFLELTVEPGIQDANLNRYYQFQKAFMDGATEWNTEPESHIALRTSMGRIGRQGDQTHGPAVTSEVAWPEYEAMRDYRNRDNDEGDLPGYMSNFDLTSSCQKNTVVCCFTNDRTGTDGSEDDLLIPNAGVCSHDVADSPDSNHIDNGWVTYNPDGAGDKDAYCEGFTWEDGADSDRFKGNLLFQLSFWNTFKNGYVGNIPAAPMCACIEQMPKITAAASISLSSVAADTYSFTYSNGTLDGTHSVDLTFARGDDLLASNPEDLSEHIVGSCDTEEYLNAKLFVPGSPNDFGVSESQWDKIVGEGLMYQPMIGEEEFRERFDASETQIIYRKCITCQKDTYYNFHDIYYKRFTPYPDELDFLDLLMNEWTETSNVLGEDMCLYSTYEDALNGFTNLVNGTWIPDDNCWKSCDYNLQEYEGVGFPRNCHPEEGKYASNNWNSYAPTRLEQANADYHAFYLDTSTTGRR